MPRIRHALTLLAAIPLTACAPPPSSLRPTLHAQRLATDQLAATWAQDHALLRAQTESLLRIRATILRGAAHRSLLLRGYLTPTGEPDPLALDRDLADPDARSPLVDDIRAGLLTRDQAVAWLTDYALAQRMTRPDAACAPLLRQLSPLRRFEAAAEAVRSALDARAASTRALLAELDASTSALSAYTDAAPTPATRAALAALITAHTPDPALRDAALDLLNALFTDTE